MKEGMFERFKRHLYGDKPHLERSRGRTPSCWYCMGQDEIGIGDDPRRAYEAWKAALSRPKRWAARL